MALKVNLNADIGESFGKYRMGNDEELMTIIKAANIACGMHAGDPTVMHNTTLLAAKNGCSIGVHPGYNDLWGFGRREMKMKLDDLEHLVAYQIGALYGIAQANGLKVSYVKPHGQLHNMAIVNVDIADAICKAVKSIDRDLIFVGLADSQLEVAGRKHGLRFAREGYVDRRYEEDGNLTSRTQGDAVIKDAKEAADQVVRMIRDRLILTRTGKELKLKDGIHSLCVHGDEPTAIAVARGARDGLVAAGISILPITEMGI